MAQSNTKKYLILRDMIDCLTVRIKFIKDATMECLTTLQKDDFNFLLECAIEVLEDAKHELTEEVTCELIDKERSKKDE